MLPTVYRSVLTAGVVAAASCAGPPPADADPALRRALVDLALAQRGAPYRYGGRDPRGFDCSGLIWWLHRQLDIEVPRDSLAQYRASRPVPLRDLRPGDLVFFRTDGARVSHVGLYLGDGRFLHAPGRGRTVGIDRLDADYWRRRFAGGGRFLP
ncbi:MAG: hypothetical protein KatS3mg121_0405 [Gammaproteobacteria bacterium]|nr:MAG: hypothetical protein KatS3mg121_0405 [Gammaproteobacteria bacterium]